MVEERTCEECGWRIEPDTRVCDHCGATQSGAAGDGQSGGRRAEPSQEAPDSFRRIFKIVVLVIVAVTILISLVMALVIGWALFG